MAMTESQEKISKVCDQIKQLLLDKNAKYGDSALNPCRIFSKASNVEQLLVRIDDKLNRIQKGAGLLAADEDVVNDLIGYLVLLKIALADGKQENKPDTNLVYFNDQVSDFINFNSGTNGYYPNDPWDGIDIEPSFKPFSSGVVFQ